MSERDLKRKNEWQERKDQDIQFHQVSQASQVQHSDYQNGENDTGPRIDQANMHSAQDDELGEAEATQKRAQDMQGDAQNDVPGTHIQDSSLAQEELASRKQDLEDLGCQEIESLCTRCYEQGQTRLMLTSIPFFKEIILMSFHCPHCDYSHNEVQSAAQVSLKGQVINIKIQKNLQNIVVRSSTASLKLLELELELPPNGKGNYTNLEGILQNIKNDLELDQDLREKNGEPEFEVIKRIIERLNGVLEGEDSLELSIRDPAGQSYVQGAVVKEFARSRADNVELGLVADEQVGENEGEGGPDAESSNSQGANQYSTTKNETDNVDDDCPQEIYDFPASCSSCGHECSTKMQKIDIPHFQDVFIMSTACFHCGYRDNEVKSAGAIPALGRKITLNVRDISDLSRDILKYETCGMEIPEIGLTLETGTLGGRFTTLEGLIVQIHEQLSGQTMAAEATDSLTQEVKDEQTKMQQFLDDLIGLKDFSRPFTVILDDPMASSYIQNPYAPDKDPEMTILDYTRTFDQDEELGLNDIKVDDYEESEPQIDAQNA